MFDLRIAQTFKVFQPTLNKSNHKNVKLFSFWFVYDLGNSMKIDM